MENQLKDIGLVNYCIINGLDYFFAQLKYKFRSKIEKIKGKIELFFFCVTYNINRTIMSHKEFCQKSRDGLCRFDALCNAIGKSIMSLEQFYKYCDEFDEKYDITDQFSRTYFSIFKDEKTDKYDNIFSHILDGTGKYQTKYVEANILYPSDLTDCIAFIAFNDIHTWAIRRSKKNKDNWVELDDKVRFIHPGKTMSFVGAVLIYPKHKH